MGIAALLPDIQAGTVRNVPVGHLYTAQAGTAPPGYAYSAGKNREVCYGQDKDSANKFVG